MGSAAVIRYYEDIIRFTAYLPGGEVLFMFDVIKRTFDARALFFTILFSVIFHGVSGVLFSARGIAASDSWPLAVGLIGFAIGGLVYALLIVRRLSDIHTIDLIGVGVWIVLSTGVGSLPSVIFFRSWELTQWTASGIQGELLAVATGFITLLVHEPTLLSGRQDA